MTEKYIWCSECLWAMRDHIDDEYKCDCDHCNHMEITKEAYDKWITLEGNADYCDLMGIKK